MNKKTAKHIRKFVARNSDHKFFKKTCREIKKRWNALPWNKRHAMRKEME